MSASLVPEPVRVNAPLANKHHLAPPMRNQWMWSAWTTGAQGRRNVRSCCNSMPLGSVSLPRLLHHLDELIEVDATFAVMVEVVYHALNFLVG